MNSLNSPTLKHAKEEMLDFINYIAHEVFKSRLMYPDQTEELEEILGEAFGLYDRVHGVELEVE
jgi:hypothetical protein